jgi:hypothetical protein
MMRVFLLISGLVVWGDAMTGRRVVRGAKVASGSRVKLGLAVFGLRNKVDSLYLESDYKGFMD